MPRVTCACRGYQSPLSKNQEVSTLNRPENSNEGTRTTHILSCPITGPGDEWVVECVNANAKFWQRTAQVRLQHQQTGTYLHHSNRQDVRVACLFIQSGCSRARSISTGR